MRTFRIPVLVSLGAVGMVLTGCSGGGSSAVAPPVTRAYLGTQAPGDVWDWNIMGAAFTATNETTGFTYKGSVTNLPTGFMKLGIESTTDPGVTAGQAAYALELPGTALIIKPAGADTKPPIVASSLGANPPGPTVSFNYVEVAPLGWQPTSESYGHVLFTVTGNDYSGPTKRFAIDGTALPDGSANFTGENGLMTTTNTPGNVPAKGAMTPSGVCVLDYGPGNGGTIGVRQPAQPIDLAVIGTKSFLGYLINQGKTQCVTCSPNGDGTLHGMGYANPSGVETGTSDDGAGVTITFVSQPNPGQVRMSISTPDGTETIAACFSQVNGKYMLFGFGVGNGGMPYNIMFVEK